MSLTLAAIVALSQQCAPGIALEAIVPQLHVESHFDELAIGINHGPKVVAHSPAQAVAIASGYIRAGYSVDLGLAQINSGNLQRLGIGVAVAFDPCTSLKAASVVLNANYQAVSASRSGVDAINATWSLYNSGSTMRGISNGYVRKVWAAADALVPQMRSILGVGRLPQPTGESLDANPIAPGRIVLAPPGAPLLKSSWFYGTPNADAIVFKAQ